MNLNRYKVKEAISAVLSACVLAGVVCAVLWLTGCSTGSATHSVKREVTVYNDLGKVAYPVSGGEKWVVQTPPTVQFTEARATAAEIRQWAADNGLRVATTLTDGVYAQLEAKSAVEAILWLKRFNADTGQVYINSQRDCEDFASKAQLYPTMFAERTEAAPAVFVIFATMDTPFAGVSDGYHALNAVWTDKGIFVFEPQGISLVYQDLLSWPNVKGITHNFSF